MNIPPTEENKRPFHTEPWNEGRTNDKVLHFIQTLNFIYLKLAGFANVHRMGINYLVNTVGPRLLQNNIQ